MEPYKFILILGPTAAGKSALGVRLAQKFGGVIISADSRQVYRGLDIGTGKITAREMQGVPHFLLNVASPRGQYSVARYVQDVKKVLRQIDPSVPIFLVGGSPFYIKAVTEPGSFSDVPPNQTLRRRLENTTAAQLIKQLRKLDPIRAITIDRANRRRLIRAIEIASFQPPKKSGVPKPLPPMHVLKIGIAVSRQKLYKKIDRRVDRRLAQGMITEVRRLHHHGLSWKTLDAFGLEYRFISRYLRDQITKAEMGRQLGSAIHGFAKRQMTWWKREKDIQWVTSPDQANRLINKFLK